MRLLVPAEHVQCVGLIVESKGTVRRNGEGLLEVGQGSSILALLVQDVTTLDEPKVLVFLHLRGPVTGCRVIRLTTTSTVPPIATVDSIPAVYLGLVSSALPGSPAGQEHDPIAHAKPRPSIFADMIPEGDLFADMLPP